MDRKTRFVYENAIGKVEFAAEGPFWVTDLAGVSGVTVDISETRSIGQIGASIAAESVQPRTFTVNGCFFGPLAQHRQKLIDVFAPAVPAAFTVVRGGEEWFLSVVPKSTPEIELGEGVQHFQVQLHAAYPYWRTKNRYTVQLAGLRGVFRFPFYTGGVWKISEFTAGFYQEIINDGNVPLGFEAVVLARSALVDPEIYHMTEGTRIRFVYEMQAGDAFTVNTAYGEMGATLTKHTGEVENAYRYLHPASNLSMSIKPGANLLRTDAAQNREGLSVRLWAYEGVKSGV